MDSYSNPFSNSDVQSPIMEADSAIEEEERARKKLARKRIFGVLVSTIVILLGLVIWQVIEIFSSL